MEYRLLYAMVVAGKSAEFAQAAMQRFMENQQARRQFIEGPFDMVARLVKEQRLHRALIAARTGQHHRLVVGFAIAAMAGLNLRECTPEQLETIPGVGPKTSRFFILWTRGNARYAALDTHVLKWLGYLGLTKRRSTPPKGKAYADLERIFIAEADRRGKTPRELDERIWIWCSVQPRGWHRCHEDDFWPLELRKDAREFNPPTT